MSKVLKSRGNTHLYLLFPGETGAFTEGSRLAEVKTGGLSTSTGTIDVTNWDSGDWQEIVPDIKSGTMGVTTNLILDSAQLPKINAANGGGRCKFLLIFGDKPALGAKNLAVYGNARLMNLNYNVGDTHELAFDLTVDGAPVFEVNATAFPTVA